METRRHIKKTKSNIQDIKLLEFPHEIIYMITELLPLTDLNNFALTCHFIRNIAQDIVAVDLPITHASSQNKMTYSFIHQKIKELDQTIQKTFKLGENKPNNNCSCAQNCQEENNCLIRISTPLVCSGTSIAGFYTTLFLCSFNGIFLNIGFALCTGIVSARSFNYCANSMVKNQIEKAKKVETLIEKNKIDHLEKVTIMKNNFRLSLY